MTTKNKRVRCVVCGNLTPFKICINDKVLPCHIDCLDVLRLRGFQDQELEVVSGVV